MTATFTTANLAELHSQGYRYITQVEGKVAGLTHLLADDADHAATLAKVWVGKFHAPSAATYRILPNGKLNLIRFFDYNDVEAA
jgi:hypothetical protein